MVSRSIQKRLLSGKHKRRPKTSLKAAFGFLTVTPLIIFLISTHSTLKTETIDLESLTSGQTIPSKSQDSGIEVNEAVSQNDDRSKVRLDISKDFDIQNAPSNTVYEDRKGDAFLTMFGAHRVQPSLKNLPKWLQGYFAWHRGQTEGGSVKNDTKYIAMTCLGKDKCGGFSDRLRALPFFLLVGRFTNRVLCIHWSKPFGLEEFLEPPPGGINWRCPEDMVKEISGDTKSRWQTFKYREFGYDRGFTSMVDATEHVFKQLEEIDEEKYILTGLVTQDFQKINRLNNIFQAHTYRDKIPVLGSWQHLDVMGDIFRVMFQPVEDVSKQVNVTMAKLGLKENEFTSVHIRARYPTNHLMNILSKDAAKATDKGLAGFKFEGKVEEYMTPIAVNALTCAYDLGKRNDALPIFLSSDSIELTSHLSTSATTIKSTDSPIIPLSLQREDEILHMEGGKTDVRHSDFFPVLEDLLIMGASKCVAHGIGSFGAFAAAIGGNRCRDIHRNHAGKTEECPNGRASRTGLEIKEGDLLFGEKPGGEGKLEYGDDFENTKASVT